MKDIHTKEINLNSEEIVGIATNIRKDAQHLCHLRNTNQHHNEIPFTHTRIVIIQKTDSDRFW